MRVAQKRHVVLCVDDEASVPAGFAQGLGRAYGVNIVAGGSAALALMCTLPEITVIICDMRMQTLYWAQFLAASRTMAPKARRLLLTGDIDIYPAIAAMNQGGIFRLLSKPCPIPLLIETVAAAVEDYETEARDLRRSRARAPAVRESVPIGGQEQPIVYARSRGQWHRGEGAPHD
jgi:DNA-binding NtrC family response regulator